jgi:hypothetical protein
MPQLSLKYTDKTLIELAATMGGIIWRGPKRPPKSVLGGKPAANAGPDSQVDEGGTVILRCHLLPFIGIPCTKQSGARRNDTALVRSQASFELFIEPILSAPQEP